MICKACPGTTFRGSRAIDATPFAFAGYSGDYARDCGEINDSDPLILSDQGQQYAGAAYRAALARHGMAQSMSRKGNCLDNAVAESFFSNVKNELVHHEVFEDRDEARSANFDYMEVFYNRQRLHQSLGFKSHTTSKRWRM